MVCLGTVSKPNMSRTEIAETPHPEQHKCSMKYALQIR